MFEIPSKSLAWGMIVIPPVAPTGLGRLLYIVLLPTCRTYGADANSKGSIHHCRFTIHHLIYSKLIKLNLFFLKKSEHFCTEFNSILNPTEEVRLKDLKPCLRGSYRRWRRFHHGGTETQLNWKQL